MNSPRKKGEMVSVATSQISPIHTHAIAVTAEHYKTMTAFVQAQMKKNVDFGVIPGTKKPTLLKPGAEKLCRLFSLRPGYELIDFISDFDKPIFHYHYRCTLVRQGEMVGQGDGSCNSREKKYEAQKYKIFDLTNTICCLGARYMRLKPLFASFADAGSHRKMAQKRALVAAVLSSCGASSFFTQDLEDMGGVK